MYNSWLEQLRFSLQSIQVLEKAIVSEMLSINDNPKEKSIAEHRINNYAEMIQQKSKQVLNFMKDEANMKKQEIAIIEGQKQQKGLKITEKKKTMMDVIWQNYYDKCREMKEYYKKNQSSNNTENSVEYFRRICFQPPFKDPEFSLQENKGRYVDMHSIYVEYLNIYKVMQDKDNMKLHDYLWFLQNMDKFDDFPLHKKMKHQKKYQSYLNTLNNYFQSFINRSRPLFQYEGYSKKVKQEFDKKFSEGSLPGWEPENDNLNQDQLQYCSYCEKLFISEHAYITHLSGKVHLKYLKMKEDLNMEGPQFEEKQIKAKQELKQNHLSRKKQIAFDEFRVRKFREQLANTIYDTMNLVRKKQTRGYEDVDEIYSQSSQSEDVDAPVYNPKNLPLGWDGKPIPYWLYKLHGLGIQYKCQICGNYSYWGRRAFQTHFQQWRHTYGMKCLKIPNTIHFKDVTSINDALALHDKLMRQSQESQFRPQIQEQFEDNQGNILNKRTYFDMKKQGLLD